MSSKHLKSWGQSFFVCYENWLPIKYLIGMEKKELHQNLKISVSEGLKERRGERCWKFINTGVHYSLSLTLFGAHCPAGFCHLPVTEHLPISSKELKEATNYLTIILTTLSVKKKPKPTKQLNQCEVISSSFYSVQRCFQSPVVYLWADTFHSLLH